LSIRLVDAAERCKKYTWERRQWYTFRIANRASQVADKMELNPLQAGRTVVLSPAGRIDHTHAEAFERALAPHLCDCGSGGVALLLDFSGVSYISSIGLRALMVAQRQVKSQGGRMALAALTPLVLEVFTITRFDLVFEIFPTRADALAAGGSA
jgi:anti-anti-sigma factor